MGVHNNENELIPLYKDMLIEQLCSICCFIITKEYK